MVNCYLLFVVCGLFCMTAASRSENAMLDAICGICSSYNEDNGPSSTDSQVYSRPGKRGGKGEKGSKGEPDVADFKRIKTIAKNEVVSGLTECRAEITEMKSKIMNLPGVCPVIYDKKCFWGVFVGTGTTTREEASALCEKRGGKLAGLYSNEQFEQLYPDAYLHLAAKESRNLAMWTSMTLQNKRTLFRDGTPASSSLKWRLGYPDTRSGNTKIILEFDLDRTNDGLMNWSENSGVYGAMCEIDL